MFGSKKAAKSAGRQPHDYNQNSVQNETPEEDDEDDIFNGLAKELGVSGYEIDDDDDGWDDEDF